MGKDILQGLIHRTEYILIHFSHFHWDHIQGLPLFGPAFVPSTELTLFGGEGLEDALRGQMQGPYFPVAWDDLASRRDCQPLRSNMGFSVGPFNITARSLCHPQGSLGFRIEAAGKSVCFATDTEQRLEDDIDPALMSLAKDVDLLIHDAQYTAAEYRGELGPPRHGWGHSTYVAACAAAEASGAKQLALFHHDPTHDDALMDALEADARTYFTATRAAREGLSVEL